MPYFKGTRKFLRALLRLKIKSIDTNNLEDMNMPELEEAIRVLEEQLFQIQVSNCVVFTCIVVGTVGLGVSLVLTGGTITIPIAISIAFLSLMYGSALLSLVYNKCFALRDNYAEIKAELTDLKRKLSELKTTNLNQMV